MMPSSPAKKFSAIPTNIITGFLGVGKTTTITQLLQQKTGNERWGVLVNEFGEVGIDGGLFEGTKFKRDTNNKDQNDEQEIFITEVPGGCMCCAAGLPMQMALNMLIKRARPDRLLIEPTGLGHPVEVMEVLSSNSFKDVLDIHSTITLVDARKLQDKRYTQNETFNQQLDIADVVVANKAELYSDDDLLQLIHYLAGRHKERYRPVLPTQQGAFDIEWLDGSPSTLAVPQKQTGHDHDHDHDHDHNHALQTENIEFGEEGYMSIENRGEGFFSQGWIFKPDIVFDRTKLSALMHGLHTERAKGVFITHQGVIGFNLADNVLTEIALDDSMDSRIEIIVDDPANFAGVEQQLLACI